MENIKSAISIQDLSIKYGQNSILTSVNLEIEEGSIYAIIGPNGSGKSSLINSISGDVKYSGDILLNKKNLSQINRKELACMISKLQSNGSINNIKVSELVEMGRIPKTDFLGRLKEIDHQIIKSSIELTGIKELLNKSLHELSDGERRKVLITKALIQDCPIMLMDEPTTFLDVGNKYSFSQLIKKINQDYQKTIFMSTHDLDLAFSIADKIVLIVDQNIEVHLPETVKKERLLERVFSKYDVKLDENGNLLF
jgi:iron complex transport system ATP-binding protein